MEWGAREHRMKQQAERLSIKLPVLYLRQVDDIFFVYVGTRAELQTFQDLCDNMDPNRNLTWEVSAETANWLDLTVYKGENFQRTGALDTQLYQKPTDI